MKEEGRRKREEAVRPRDDASRKGMRTKRGRRVEIEKKGETDRDDYLK
ncbi:hypothetical protein [Okeania sp. KiyG1]|nr:hypothetical protein [Okeania sp. KiyG1]